MRRALLASVLLCSPVAGYGPMATVPGALRAPRSTLLAFRMNAAPEEGGEFGGRIASLAPKQELPQVRAQLEKLVSQLSDAIEDEDYVHAAMIRDDIAEMRSKDPAVMADSLREDLERHVKREEYAEAARCRDELRVLRRYLPQYQLAGLWKGNYPNHGEELVRLHYDGDLLYATKVTGDEHVPAGKITFRADLTAPVDGSSAEWSGSRHGGEDDSVGVRVEVLSISADGGHEQREVEQFCGEGRIAARGFRHSHYVPGQLFLMDDDVVGFLWLPIGTFVVFSRVPEEDELAATKVAASGAAAALGLTPAGMAATPDEYEKAKAALEKLAADEASADASLGAELGAEIDEIEIEIDLGDSA